MVDFLNTVEAAIVERLKTVFAGFEVLPFPKAPKNYRFIHPRGAVLVVYRGSTYKRPEDTHITAQERNLRWDVTIIARDLRSHTGAYAMTEKAIASLLGWEPPDCDRMALERDAFENEEDGVWQYGLTFSAVTMAIEDKEIAETPLLTQVEYEEQIDEAVHI